MTVLFFSPRNNKKQKPWRVFWRVIKQAENCSPEDAETALIRDTFILNMLHFDTQKELPKKTVPQTKALEIAIHIEMAAQSQQKINQNLDTNAQSVNIVNNFQGSNRTTNYQQQRKDPLTNCTPKLPIHWHLRKLRSRLEP